MTEQALYRRLARRSLHRSRSAAVVVALVVLSLVAVYVGIEATLAALGRGPLLISPADAVAALESPTTIVLAGAAVVAILGIVFVLLALLPGSRGRHEVPNERLAVVVDDSVLAGAIGGVAQRASGVAPSRVVTSVSKRRGAVTITPTSGVPLDSAALSATAQDFVHTLQPRPAVKVGVTVAANGVVGA
jgi:hypothetical protein